MFLLFQLNFLQCFIYKRADILDYRLCNISCCAYKELGQSDFYSFDQEKVFFVRSIYLPPTHIKMLPQEKSCLPNLAYNIFHRVDIHMLVKRLTSSFC